MTEVIEKLIVAKLIRVLVSQNMKITVFDGEEVVVKKSSDVAEIFNAMFATDEETLRVFDSSGENLGAINLVYGNDGFDVISEYHLTLEDALKPLELKIRDLEYVEGTDYESFVGALKFFSE